MAQRQCLIIGISGATGVIYGIRLLQVLKEHGIETHLVVTKAAEMTRAYETDLSAQQLRSLADVWYPVTDIEAAIASGSFKTMGMIIASCSIREIEQGITSNLLTRAADVVLKERCRLVLMLLHTAAKTSHDLSINLGAMVARCAVVSSLSPCGAEGMPPPRTGEVEMLNPGLERGWP